MAGVSHSTRMNWPRAPELFWTCAVDQNQPALGGTVAFALAAPAGAERDGPFRGFGLHCNGPGAAAALPGKVLEGRAAQAAARRQQRDGLQQIGLARTIGARQGNGRPVNIQPQAGIVAEVGEREAFERQRAGMGHGRPAYTRMGIST